jgi:hypothetical protein
VTGPVPVAPRLAFGSIGLATAAVVAGSLAAPDGLALVFGLAGVLALGGWAVGLWLGRSSALAGAVATSAALVSGAAWAGDAPAVATSVTALVLWSGWMLGHLSLVLRAEAVAPRVIRSALAPLAALGFTSAALAGTVAAFADQAPDRGVEAEALAVMTIVAIVVVSAALVPTPSRDR